ncbi:MAG: hypothetical protein ACI9CQ_001437, partial [Saprospiraceae bacterium]
MKEIKGLFNEKFQIRKPLLPQTLLLLLLLSLLPLSAFSQVILQGYV